MYPMWTHTSEHNHLVQVPVRFGMNCLQSYPNAKSNGGNLIGSWANPKLAGMPPKEPSQTHCFDLTQVLKEQNETKHGPTLEKPTYQFRVLICH